jgi:hypothetical protein
VEVVVLFLFVVSCLFFQTVLFFFEKKNSSTNQNRAIGIYFGNKKMSAARLYSLITVASGKVTVIHNNKNHKHYSLIYTIH